MVNIEDFLSADEFRSKQDIADITGLTERSVRHKISDLKMVKPVIYNSQTKGYRLAKNFLQIPLNEVKEEAELIQHCINDIQARKKVFDKQLRTYIAYLKALEKLIG